MKKTLFGLLFVISITVFSQAPEAINYQAVARDAGGSIITTAIGVKFQIHQGSAAGPVVFDETNTIIPSSVGIFTAAIGRGTPGIGTFSSSINWGSGSYYLEVSIDPAGGTSYTSVGTSELLSVPYALYAKTSGNAATTYSAGAGISISSGSIINTAMNQTVNISGAGTTTVSGTYPNYLISTPGATATPPPPNITVNSPHTTTTLSPGNYSINVQPTNLTGPNVIGSYPNYTVGAGPNPNIIGGGVTNINTAGNSYTVNTPPVNMTFLPGMGILSYSPAIGINTINISPTVTFTNNVITVGSNSTTIPGTGIWTKPTAVITTLANANDNVGIGIATPGNRLHVIEAVSGIAAVKAINTYTTISVGSAMGLWAESNNPSGSSAGVYGVHNGGGNGVSGISSTNTYSSTAGVYGYAAGTLSTNVSIHADVNNGNSIGVFVNSFPSHTGTGLYSLKSGSAGNAAKLEISNTSNSADALFAITNGLGSAIHTKNTISAGANNLGLLVEDAHLGSFSAAPPTIGTTACTACLSASLQVQSNDIAGTFTFSMTATYGAAFGYTVTFNKAYRKKPIVVLSPVSPVAAAANYYVTIVGVVGNYTGFTINWPLGISGGAGAASYNYIVIESSN